MIQDHLFICIILQQDFVGLRYKHSDSSLLIVLVLCTTDQRNFCLAVFMPIWKPAVPDCFFSALAKLVKKQVTNVHAFLLLQHQFSFVDHFLIWWQTNKAGFVNNLLHTILLSCFRCFVSRGWYWTVLLLLYSATFIRHVFTFYHLVSSIAFYFLLLLSTFFFLYLILYIFVLETCIMLSTLRCIGLLLQLQFVNLNLNKFSWK